MSSSHLGNFPPRSLKHYGKRHNAPTILSRSPRHLSHLFLRPTPGLWHLLSRLCGCHVTAVSDHEVSLRGLCPLCSLASVGALWPDLHLRSQVHAQEFAFSSYCFSCSLPGVSRGAMAHVLVMCCCNHSEWEQMFTGVDNIVRPHLVERLNAHFLMGSLLHTVIKSLENLIFMRYKKTVGS